MLLPESRAVSDDELLDCYDWPDRPCVRGLMAMTLDGAFVGPDGLSSSISGPADRRVLAAGRALADAYLVGAGTVRTEEYTAVRARPELRARRAARGQRPAPVLAIVTATCRFDWPHAAWLDSDERPIVLTAEVADPGLRMAAAQLGCDVVVAGAERVDLRIALAALADRGLTRVNCEGGPTLLGELIAADLVDELALTVSPLLTHARVPHAPGPVVRTGLHLAQLLEADGFLFGRYRRAPGGDDQETAAGPEISPEQLAAAGPTDSASAASDAEGGV